MAFWYACARPAAAWGRSALLLCALGMLPTATSAASPSAGSVLRRMARAQRGVNLRGRMVVVNLSGQQPRISTKRIVRSRSGRSLALYLDPPAQRGTIMSDDGAWMCLFEPRRKTVSLKRSMPLGRARKDIDRQVRLIQHNYRVRVEGRENSAGRECYRVIFEPRTPGRRSFQLWIDQATGVPLWRKESDPRGNTLSLAMYTSVEYPARIAASEVLPAFPRGARRLNMSRSVLFDDVGHMRRATGFPVRLPLRMPSGHAFCAGTIVAVGGRPTAYLHYTDGMTDLTICESRPPPERPAQWLEYSATRTARDETVVYLGSDRLDVLVIGREEPRMLMAVAHQVDHGDEGPLLARLRQSYGASARGLASMRDRGLSVDSLAALLVIARRSGKPFASLAALCLQGWTWRDMAARFGLPPKAVERRVLSLRR